MLLFIRPLNEALRRRRDPDELALQQFGKLLPWQSRRAKIKRYFVQLAVASLVAWVVSIPLVAYHFEQFTPWAVPISIILSPLVILAVAGGFAKLIASMLMPSLAPAWASLAAAPVALLRHAMALAVHLPWADIPIGQPPLWAILLFYALLCVQLLPWPRKRMLVALRAAPLGFCALCLPMPLPGWTHVGPPSGSLRVTLLSIGAGQCAVVEPPTGRCLMIDAGSSTLGDPLHLCVEPFLHHEGRSSLGSVYLSHGDYDHISAVEEAAREDEVDQVITTPFFRRHAEESRPCEHLLEYLDASNHRPTEVTAGQTFSWGGASAVVLWPTASCDMNSNNAGMVVRLTYAGKSILFPADIQDPAMRELLKQPQILRSDVLVAAHHGSSESLTADFVRAVNPEVIVSSNASRLTKKQRDFETRIDHRPLYRTNHCGAITIEIDRDGRLTVTPFLREKQPAIAVERDGSVHWVQ